MCGRACTKAVSTVFNVLFLLSGVLLLLLSIWMAVDDELHESVLLERPDLLYHRAPWNGQVWGLLVIAIFVIFSAIIGLFGVGCENPPTIVAFLVFGSISILACIIYGSVATYTWNRATDGTPRDMAANLRFMYNGEEAKDTFSQAWNDLQVSDACCGAYNYTDYESSVYTHNTNNPVPWTCCVMTIKEVDVNNVLNRTACMLEARQPPTYRKAHLHAKGCGYDHVEYLTSRGITIYAIVWTCVFVQFWALVTSGCMKDTLRYDKIEPQKPKY